MRRRNLLRYPLNGVFGTEAHVRVLRALLAHGGELSPPAIASRTGLTPQGTRHVLSALVKTGVVVEKGSGRYKHYEVAATNPLVPALEALFRAESERYHALLDAIRSAGKHVARRPHAVWLYGSAARGEDHLDSDVDIAVVFESEPIDAAVERFREAVEEVAAQFGLRLSVIGLSKHDVHRLSGGDSWWIGVQRDARALLGPDPDTYVRQVRKKASEGAHGEGRP
jgi:predicted nucleotidyltransferase